MSERLSGADLKGAAGLLKVLSHPARLRLALHLARGECSVAAMERDLGIRQPGLSQHLGELRAAGLVATRREHKVVFYALTDPRALDLVSQLTHIFGDAPHRSAPHRPSTGRTRAGGAAAFALTGDAA